MAGRKPKPTAVKKLEGNPGKRKLNTKEPVPGKGMPDCPKWLLPDAREEWKRLSEKLNQMGVLTEIDRSAFAAYCQSYARWKEAQATTINLWAIPKMKRASWSSCRRKRRSCGRCSGFTSKGTAPPRSVNICRKKASAPQQGKKNGMPP